jgi:hypothetical protein
MLSYTLPRIKIAFELAGHHRFITMSGRLVTKTFRVIVVS